MKKLRDPQGVVHYAVYVDAPSALTNSAETYCEYYNKPKRTLFWDAVELKKSVASMTCLLCMALHDAPAQR